MWYFKYLMHNIVLMRAHTVGFEFVIRLALFRDSLTALVDSSIKNSGSTSHSLPCWPLPHSIFDWKQFYDTVHHISEITAHVCDWYPFWHQIKVWGISNQWHYTIQIHLKIISFGSRYLRRDLYHPNYYNIHYQKCIKNWHIRLHPSLGHLYRSNDIVYMFRGRIVHHPRIPSGNLRMLSPSQTVLSETYMSRNPSGNVHRMSPS